MFFLKRYVAAFLLLFVLLLLGLLPVSAGADVHTTNITQTLGQVRYFDCAGEFIEFWGDYHSVFHGTVTPNSKIHVIFVSNSSGVAGVGLSSGTPYHVVDGEHRTTNIFGVPGFESNVYDTFRLIGAGQAANIQVTVVTHLTFNPMLGFTAQVTNVSSTCQN